MAAGINVPNPVSHQMNRRIFVAKSFLSKGLPEKVANLVFRKVELPRKGIKARPFTVKCRSVGAASKLTYVNLRIVVEC